MSATFVPVKQGQPQLEDIRLNRPPFDDDVNFSLTTLGLTVPLRTTCNNASPELLSGIIVSEPGGASLDEVITKVTRERLIKSV
jgi:hypothetical protein